MTNRNDLKCNRGVLNLTNWELNKMIIRKNFLTINKLIRLFHLG